MLRVGSIEFGSRCTGRVIAVAGGRIEIIKRRIETGDALVVHRKVEAVNVARIATVLQQNHRHDIQVSSEVGTWRNVSPHAGRRRIRIEQFTRHRGTVGGRVGRIGPGVIEQMRRKVGVGSWAGGPHPVVVVINHPVAVIIMSIAKRTVQIHFATGTKIVRHQFPQNRVDLAGTLSQARILVS